MKRGYTYEAFGNINAHSGGLDDDVRFTSKEQDGTGLHYFGARYYNTDWGRFLTPDPHSLNPGNLNLSDPQTFNPYAYCSNDPLKYKDPNGRYRTRTENGNLIVYTPTVSGATAQEFVSLVPVVGLAFLGIRKAQGDVTISGSDWGFAGAGAVLWGIGKAFSGAGQSVKIGIGIAKGITDIQLAYSSQSEVMKAYLDRVILGMYAKMNPGALKNGTEINVGKRGSKEERKEMGKIEHLRKVVTRILLQGEEPEDVLSGNEYKAFLDACQNSPVPLGNESYMGGDYNDWDTPQQ